MKRKIFFLIFIFLSFLCINNFSVKAYVDYESDLDWIDSKCLNNNKCLAMCSYYQTAQNTPAQGVRPTTYYSGIYIYYYFDGSWQVSWDEEYGVWQRTGKTITKKGKAEDVFGDKIFIQGEAYENLTKKAICPKYAYVDGAAYSEACFDNDGKHCGKMDGWMTSFTSDKKSEHSLYNINDDLNVYFQNYDPDFDDCDSLEKCDIDKVMNDFVNDFQKNYLKSNKIPTFIKNNPNYEKGLSEVKKKYYELEEKLKEKIDNNTTLTEKEKEEQKEQINDTLSNALNRFEEKLQEITEVEDFEIQPGDIIPNSCKVIPDVIRKWINNILNFVRYVALALVIALGALDFMKAAGTGEPDSFKKAGQSFLKRMIAVVILFLLPYIVDLILNLVDLYGVDLKDPTCTNISQ